MLDKVFLNICFTSSQQVLQRNLPYLRDMDVTTSGGGVLVAKKHNHHLRNLPKCKRRRWTSPTSLATNH